MQKFLRIIICMAALLVVCPVSAKKLFYDSKSWIVNVAGDYGFLQEIGLSSKVNPLQVEIPNGLTADISDASCKALAARMTANGYGNRVINALTGDGKKDDYLRQLALANATRQDIELSGESLRAEGEEGLKTVVMDDYEPILLHNYIVLTHVVSNRSSSGSVSTTTYYAIFKVEVSKEEAFDIVASIATPNYGKLPNFPVVFLYAGRYETDKTVAEIAKNVPGLAVRGVLLRRHPARISIGENAGLHKGDLVSIYSQRMTKDGEQYSKRISRGRVGGVYNDEAQINFEAGTAGNRKNGDVVVRTPDCRTRWGIMGTMTSHVWGGQIVMDRKAGFTRSGIIHHFLMDVGFSLTDHPGDKFLVLDGNHNRHQYKSPMFGNFGLGYGIGKTFLGFMDVMPFFMVQYDASMMLDMSSDDKIDDGKSMIFGSAIRVPVGLRLSFNLKYPVKFVLEAGYAPYVGFGDDYDIVKATNKLLGAKRDGIFLNAGFIF